MHIGIDGNEANVENLVGVSVYTLNQLEYFRSIAGKNLTFRIFLKNAPRSTLPKETDYFVYEKIGSTFLWSQFSLPLRLLKDKSLNVFFSPAHYIPRFSTIPSVVTIHDLSYFYYPDEFRKKDLYQLINWTKYSVAKAKQVIAVSENTKKDLIKFYHVDEQKIQVIYNGYEKPSRHILNSDSVLSAFRLQRERYILYVGTLQPRKNISILINAFLEFKKRHPEFKLVIVGKKGWLYRNIFKTVSVLDLKKEVVFTDYVSNEELSILYENAFCFALPSLYEGFGIPLLEAMAKNCPVLSSSVSSLPEIGGDAALYFDPTNQDDLIDRLELLYKNPLLRNDLARKGKVRIKLFSWKKCAEQTLRVLEKAAVKI